MEPCNKAIQDSSTTPLVWRSNGRLKLSFGVGFGFDSREEMKWTCLCAKEIAHQNKW
jgi:hypothetical protein